MIEAGFWFDDVSFQSSRLGEPLTPAEIARVHDTALSELATAFDGLRIRFTANRLARYHVRVVQSVRDDRLEWRNDVAGQSRGMAGFGGGGVVNFTLLANGAVVYAPDDLDRAGIIEAIGRGVGRSAAHEFAHQLLPRAPLHSSRNRVSYEFYAANRPEQYFGELRWGLAGPCCGRVLPRLRRETDRRPYGFGQGVPSAGRLPRGDSVLSFCFVPKPHALIIPRWHSEKSYLTGSLGSRTEASA